MSFHEDHKVRTGKAMIGRKPKPPEERLRDKERSKTANTTDPDSRILSSAHDGFVQGFCGQAIATEDQITLACAVTNEATDFGQLKPMVEQARANLQTAGVGQAIGVVAADAGYPGRRQPCSGRGARRRARHCHQEPQTGRDERRTPARTDTEGTLENTPDGAKAPHQAGRAPLSETGRVDRTGVRTDATSRHVPLSPARAEDLQL